MFDPQKPAKTIAETVVQGIYQQEGKYWLVMRRDWSVVRQVQEHEIRWWLPSTSRIEAIVNINNE